MKKAKRKASTRDAANSPPKTKSISRKTKSNKPVMVDRAQTPGLNDSSDSIEEVNVEEVAKNVEAAAQTSPRVGSMNTQTEDILCSKEAKDFLKEDSKAAEMLKDWAKSRVFQLVQDLLSLKVENKLEVAKELENRFCNPDNADIFTEDESSYNYSLLRKRSQHADEPYDQEILEELFNKSKRTVEVLSEHLLLSRNGQIEDIVDQLQLEKEHPACGPNTSIVLMHTVYRDINIQTVIKLLLRCKKLY
jgi:hypothetical protein